MEQVDLTVEKRTDVGSRAARLLRPKGLIPANLHGLNKKEARTIVLTASDFFRATHTQAGEHVIFNLHIQEGKKKDTETAIAKEIQYDKIKGTITHIDFQSISLKEKITVPVPIHLVGQAIGVKEGGVIEQVLHEIEMEALPTDVPEHIDVNIAKLRLGEAIHVRDLNLGDAIKVSADPDDVIVLVTHMAAQETPVVAEGAEKNVMPEVISRGKEKAAE